ncbi:MAG: ACT domain-containing protein [Pseudomonadota bacterium]
MTRIFKTTELYITTEDKPGTLARVTAPIAEARINLNAICAYRMEGKAMFHIITADNENAKQKLKKAGFDATEEEVVVLETENESGTLFRAAQQLAEAEVDLDYCYATAGPQNSTWIVFATKTIESAMNVIP